MYRIWNLLTIAFVLLFSVSKKATAQTTAEIEPNNSSNISFSPGVQTLTVATTITGTVNGSGGDVNDVWFIHLVGNSNITAIWDGTGKTFTVTLVEYDNTTYSGLPVNTTLTSGGSQNMTSGKSYAIRVQKVPTDATTEAYSIALSGAALPAAGDTDPPTFDSSPAVSSVTTSGFTVGASINEGGDIYYVVVADGATAPTSANVIAGTGNGSAAVTSGNETGLSTPFTTSLAVTSLSAGTAYDVYVVARDDEGTPNLQASATKIDVTTSAPNSLLVAATVFLEGAWNGTNAMNTILEDANLVSASAPYNGTNSHAGSESIASAAAVPNGAVDWVLVELREAGSAAGAVNSTRKGSAAGFLMSDGSIKATDGTSNLSVNLSSNTGADYYVVIYHRNHLPIMSAFAIVGSSGTLTIDFTSNSANTYQTTTALVALAGSKFGMPAGDTNSSGVIDATDLSTWRDNNGLGFSYSGSGIADFNLDGAINAVDRNDFYRKNTAKTRQVPGA